MCPERILCLATTPGITTLALEHPLEVSIQASYDSSRRTQETRAFWPICTSKASGESQASGTQRRRRDRVSSMMKEVNNMTYSTPELLPIGSAKDLILGGLCHDHADSLPPEGSCLSNQVELW
jgi:hypothetical protein